jgi:hypothetical protein
MYLAVIALNLADFGLVVVSQRICRFQFICGATIVGCWWRSEGVWAGEENPDSDDRRCHAGERCCRAPGAIPRPKPVVTAPRGALCEKQTGPLYWADGGEVLMVRPRGCGGRRR